MYRHFENFFFFFFFFFLHRNEKKSSSVADEKCQYSNFQKLMNESMTFSACRSVFLRISELRRYQSNQDNFSGFLFSLSVDYLSYFFRFVDYLKQYICLVQNTAIFSQSVHFRILFLSQFTMFTSRSAHFLCSVLDLQTFSISSFNYFLHFCLDC